MRLQRSGLLLGASVPPPPGGVSDPVLMDHMKSPKQIHHVDGGIHANRCRNWQPSGSTRALPLVLLGVVEGSDRSTP